METHLKIEHLAPYLPFELIVQSNRGGIYLMDIYSNMRGSGIEKREVASVLNEEMKPILRPLSDLIKEIEHKGEKFCPYERFTDDVDNINDDTLYEFQAADGSFNVGDCKNLPMYAFNWLLSLHFDVFGLIDKGLAIDINTIKKG